MASGLRPLDAIGDGSAGTLIGRSEEGAKGIKEQVNEQVEKSRFHSIKMVAQVDQKGQLLIQIAHMLGVMGFVVVASCLDQDYRKTYPRGARPPWLGAE
jgi:hypothetical protein